ncbi:TadE/TadG family type IV pilus assembly protein [Shewanella sedimentimangrovi]|uniref:Pilus assembly protein n=1 Tax=Shewanella sedimentimangrovi TaxID=2814293 RepID=A0ABX7QZ49_9GAMM|nr:TadE/TadG family type IV pilus assembly protein [Shewanella sedimentimangrovi]QSX36822.1 pilus assembly protein [Shewanella sedimentimangrovi]
MHKSNQQGVAAVEFTIMLPILLLTVFATAELGRAIYQYNTLTKLVRDAARYLANTADIRVTTNLPDPLSDANCGNCITETKNLLVYGNVNGNGSPLLSGLSTSNVSIAVSPSGTRRLLVSASYNWQPLFGDSLSTFGLGDSIDLGFNLNTSYAVTAL